MTTLCEKQRNVFEVTDHHHHHHHRHLKHSSNCCPSSYMRRTAHAVTSNGVDHVAFPVKEKRIVNCFTKRNVESLLGKHQNCDLQLLRLSDVVNALSKWFYLTHFDDVVRKSLLSSSSKTNSRRNTAATSVCLSTTTTTTAAATAAAAAAAAAAYVVAATTNVLPPDGRQRRVASSQQTDDHPSFIRSLLLRVDGTEFRPNLTTTTKI